MFFLKQSFLRAKQRSPKAVLMKASASIYANYLTTPLWVVNFKLVNLDAAVLVDAILVKEVLVFFFIVNLLHYNNCLLIYRRLNLRDTNPIYDNMVYVI